MKSDRAPGDASIENVGAKEGRRDSYSEKQRLTCRGLSRSWGGHGQQDAAGSPTKAAEGGQRSPGDGRN